MSHPEQQQFIKVCLEKILELKNKSHLNVLEVGSYKLNNTNNLINDLLKNHKYLGTDVVKGPGVDLVINGEDIDDLNQKFDIIISGECFEHASNWKKIFASMIRNIADDGFIILTIASKGRIEHGTFRTGAHNSPGTFDNYYLNLNIKDFKKNFDISEIFKDYFFYYNIHSNDLYFLGTKKKLENLLIDEIKDLTHKSNSKLPNFKSLKRFLFASILPDKLFHNLHFINKKRKKTIKKLFF
ncbi:class I SAM-dependent methyltransferase [Candidatus Pelagibacter sp.]|nr:class I SAM-dependent methyltransferase [Candidatus Pelagibacter sp.]